MNKVSNKINVNDFIIALRPVMQNTTEEDTPASVWTGEVQVKFLTDLSKISLSEYEYSSMIKICNLMAASIPSMHENAFVRHVVEHYLMRNELDLEHIDIEEHEEEKVDDNNNIIKLVFDSETKGNA
tara:strand:+ start:2403 stop:2783 length:381 start_codon:yes stop_codon:yes gene_type:complete